MDIVRGGSYHDNGVRLMTYREMLHYRSDGTFALGSDNLAGVRLMLAERRHDYPVMFPYEPGDTDEGD